MSAPTSILLCDHRGEGLESLASSLRLAGHSVQSCPSVRATLEALRARMPDLVVLDPLIEGADQELEAILEGRERGFAVLLVCDPGQAPRAALALRARPAGALLDLVHRGASSEELLLRIDRLLALSADRGRMGELEHRASHDDKTDLLRSQVFQQRVSEHFSAALRHRFELALVLVDLDDFGSINKVWDHMTG